MKKKDKSQNQEINRIEVPHEKLSWKRRRVLGLFLTPSFLGVMTFFVLPFFVVFFYSVVDNPISKRFVFFDNFVTVFQNNAFQQAAWNTFRFSVIAVPLAVILSLLLALMLDKKIPFASQFRTAFLSPMMVPVASVVLIFRVLFDFNGAVNVLLGIFDIAKIDWFKSDYAPIVVVLLFLWKNLGYNMILFMAALGTVPKEALEVAALETTSQWKIFYYIKIRYLSPTFLFVTIMSLISSFKIFREVYLLTGDYPYESLYTLQNYMNNMFRQLDYQKLSAAAIIMAIVMIIIIAALYIVENWFGKDMEE